MLTNVISHLDPTQSRCPKLISWKYSFNRLNEEHEIAKKKKNALDNLYQTGRISQSTRDSFNNEITQAITEIEKQQKDLLQKMEQKVTELHSQIKTLEMLLANYEIQHVVGEVDEDTYQHEITLLGNGLETAKHELDIIQEAATQLCSPVQVPAAAPIPEVAPAAPTIEVTPPAPTPEAVPDPEPSQPTIETAPTPEPSPPVEIAPLPEPEAAPTPQPENIQITPPEPEIMPAICAPEPAPTEMPIETPTETLVEAQVEVVVENAVAVENQPEAEATIETPVETPTETIAENTVPIEEQPEAAIETPAENITEIPLEPVVEITEAPVENAETVEPLQPETTPIELIPQEIVQPIEEAIQAHPMEAPKEAHPEIIAEAVTEQAQNAEETQPVAEASPEENSENQHS